MSVGVTSAHRAQSEIKIKNLFSALCSEEEAERIAKEVAECFGSIDALFVTPEEVVRAMWGERISSFVRIVAAVCARRGMERFECSKLRSRSSICEYLKYAFLGECIEMVKAMPLDDRGVPICCKTCVVGTVNASDVTVRSIAEIAFAHNSKRVVIAHNHPRGDVAPSKADIALTQNLRQALLAVGITLEYHVVVAGMECELADESFFDSED